MKNILLTGKSEVGKSTLVKKVAEALGPRAGGYWTEAIWQDGIKAGYRIRTLDGKTGVLSHMTGVSLYRVGRFKVNVEDLEGMLVPAIRDASARKEIVVIDEIHKMGLFSEKFRVAVEEALNSPKRVVASLQDKQHGFIDKIRARPDVVAFEVTIETRDALVAKILETLQASIAPQKVSP